MLEGLKKIDEQILRKTYWTGSDDTKQKMMAEVLVPKKINSSKIMSIYTPKKESSSTYSISHISVVKEPDMFFLPTFRKKISDTIFLSKGDMFFSNMQTFTISVNIIGVMGKGLASRTKYQFPDAYVRYQDNCKNRELKIGKPTLFKRAIQIENELADDSSKLKQENLNGSRWFLFLATKKHWREDSKLEYIEKSMQWLMDNYKKECITSIALPALGCGLGKLLWKDVGPLMCDYLKKMDIKSCIYLPQDNQIKDEYLEKKYLFRE